MGRRSTIEAPRWVWSAEVMEVVGREISRAGVSLGELARRAGDRFGVDPESVERRLRAARGSGGVMDVHTADRYLVLVGCHLTDLPTYRAALAGELPRDRWPNRGSGRRAHLVTEAPRGRARSLRPRSPAVRG